MTPILYLCFLILAFGLAYYFFYQKSKWLKPERPFPNLWKEILEEEVLFYQQLGDEDKKLFHHKVHEFLLNCRIIGIKTEVRELDRVLIAASAVIPIFSFPHWRYRNLQEILLYPKAFNRKFQIGGKNARILGMVGAGFMEGKMILSKEALIHGFKNEQDKNNTAIHEFIHLLDKSDGVIDGIPRNLLEKQYILPWLDMVDKKIAEIKSGTTNINPYGAVNKAEFFAVLSTYFFERPELLQQKHPDLHFYLEKIFNKKIPRQHSGGFSGTTRKNTICPCASGDLFKHCCYRYA